MKIGLRTIKTAVGAALSMSIASALGLLYPTSAGIISVLSVTNTKKTSLKIGVYRLLSLALATVVSFICFSIIGFNSVAFGIYLLIFIPLAVQFKLSDGIIVSSVLVTHYLLEEDLSFQIIRNEFLLMIVGVGLALIMNLYMPDGEKRLKADQEIIEERFRKILNEMASYLNQPNEERNLQKNCTDLRALIRTSENWAKSYWENQLFAADHYYLDYFYMRRMQNNSLQDMVRILEKIVVEPEQVGNIRSLLQDTAETFSETNDGQEVLNKIFKLYENYRKKELPKTRAEFENRAQLFQFLQIFQAFIEIKTDFIKIQQEKNK